MTEATATTAAPGWRVSQRLGQLLEGGLEPLLRRQRLLAARRQADMPRLAALMVEAAESGAPLLAVAHPLRLEPGFLMALASELRWIEGRPVEVAVHRAPLRWLNARRIAAILPDGCVARRAERPETDGDFFRFALCTRGAASRISASRSPAAPVIVVESDDSPRNVARETTAVAAVVRVRAIR